MQNQEQFSLTTKTRRQLAGGASLFVLASLSLLMAPGPASAQTITFGTPGCFIIGTTVTCAPNNAYGQGIDVNGNVTSVTLQNGVNATRTSANGGAGAGASGLDINSTASALTVLLEPNVTIQTAPTIGLNGHGASVTASGAVTFTSDATINGFDTANGMTFSLQKGGNVTLNAGSTITSQRNLAINMSTFDNTTLNNAGTLVGGGGNFGSAHTVMMLARGADSTKVSFNNSGTVRSRRSDMTAVFLRTLNTGPEIEIINSGQIEADASVNAAATGAGIYAQNASTTSSSAIRVTNTASGTITADDVAVGAEHAGLGDILVSNGGTILTTSTTQRAVDLTNTLDSQASLGVIRLDQQAGGSISGADGAFLIHEGNGDVIVENAGTITATNGRAIALRRTGTITAQQVSADSRVSLTGGAVNGVSFGVDISHKGSGTSGFASSAGATVDASGANAVGVSILHQGDNSVGGAIDFDNGGTITSANGSAVELTLNDGDGMSVRNSGTITGANGMRVFSNSNTGVLDVDIASGGAVNGTLQGMFISSNGAAADIDVAGSVTLTGMPAAHGAITVAHRNVFGTAVRDMGTVTVASGGSVIANNVSAIELQAGTNFGAGGQATAMIDLQAGSMVQGGTFGVSIGASGATDAMIDTTLRLAGTISGTTRAVELGGGADTVTVTDTANITNEVNAAGGTDKLILEAGNAWSFDVARLTTQFQNFESIETGGAADLTLTGTDMGTRTIAVAGGTTANNATLSNTDFTIAAGAVLGGTGTARDIAVDGTLAPGNSIGTINASGNVAFNGGSTFAVEVDPNGTSDKLVAGGAVTISGTGTTIAVSGPNVVYGQNGTYRVIDAASVTGQFASVSDTIPDIDFVAQYGASSVDLTYAKSATPTPVTTTTTTTGTTTGTPTTGSGGTSTVTTTSNGGISDKSAYPAAGIASARLARAFTSRMNDRVRLALGDLNGSASGAGQLTSGYGASSSPYTPYALAYGTGLSVDGENGLAGYDMRGGGAGFGVDVAVDAISGTALVGAAFAIGRASSDVSDGDADVSSYQLGLNGAWSGKGWSLSGAVGYSHNDIDTSRTLDLGGGSFATALGSTDGHAFSLSAELAYDLASVMELPVSLSPFSRIDAAFADTDGYTETGAGALNLTQDGLSTDQTSVTFGLRVAKDFVDGETRWRPYGALGYAVELGDDSPSSTALLAATNTLFTDTLASTDRNRAVVEAGLSFENATVTGTMSYRGAFGSDSREHEGLFKLGVRF